MISIRFVMTKYLLITLHFVSVLNMNQNDFTSTMRLWCQTGNYLTIRPSGEVVGTHNAEDPDSLIEIKSGGNKGLVRILGKSSNLYVSFDQKGKLYGEKNPLNKGTIFNESLRGGYTMFQSTFRSKNWFIGFRRDGRPMKVSRIGASRKGILFLPIRKLI